MATVVVVMVAVVVVVGMVVVDVVVVVGGVVVVAMVVVLVSVVIAVDEVVVVAVDVVAVVVVAVVVVVGTGSLSLPPLPSTRYLSMSGPLSRLLRRRSASQASISAWEALAVMPIEDLSMHLETEYRHWRSCR